MVYKKYASSRRKPPIRLKSKRSKFIVRKKKAHNTRKGINHGKNRRFHY